MSTGMVILVGTVLFAVGCSTGGTGLRDGGPARTESVSKTSPSTAPSAQPSPSAFKKVDVVALVRADPKVSDAVKRDLKPCSGKDYPVDVSYGKVTGSPDTDLVVNILSCSDAIGVGAYVYKPEGGKYENVFSDEAPPVYAEIDRGDLVVSKQIYGKAEAYATGEDVITYRWSGEKFTEHDRVHSEYSNVGGVGQPAPAVTPQRN
ncbi:hypothetical protein [Streptomyces sp. G-G2]|uniref:hypothetical protein n=1 Tax=Streptomyces sp. G-G2 TaxID=3046201 RepID=UPI0024BB66FE|nr:hypothetical protein [Streptomyces sp. G-G2]MDJ0384912.1 hypothetical protein [Streptomyces sp. G-G2]